MSFTYDLTIRSVDEYVEVGAVWQIFAFEGTVPVVAIINSVEDFCTPSVVDEDLVIREVFNTNDFEGIIRAIPIRCDDIRNDDDGLYFEHDLGL